MNRIGNGDARELTCTTHGRELRGWGYCWERGCRAEGDKEEKIMGKLNSIVNKIYLKFF